MKVEVDKEYLEALQRAVEHGGYLATTAEQFREASNALDAAKARLEEVVDDTEPSIARAQAVVDGATETYGEFFSGLSRDVYEFRKRADRALAMKPVECELAALLVFDIRDISTDIGFINDALAHVPAFWAADEEDRATIKTLFSSPLVNGGSVRYHAKFQTTYGRMKKWEELVQERVKVVEGKTIMGSNQQLPCKVAIGGLKDDVKAQGMELLNRSREAAQDNSESAPAARA